MPAPDEPSAPDATASAAAPRRTRRPVLWTVLGVVAALVLLVAWVGVRGGLAYRHLEHAQSLVSGIESDVVDNQDVISARASAKQLTSEADAAKNLTSDPIWRSVEIVPGLGPNMRVLRQVSGVISETADKAVNPLITLATTMNPEQFKPVDGKLPLAPLEKAQPAAAAASAALADSQKQIEAVDVSGAAAPARKAASQLSTLLGQTRGQIDVLDRTLTLLPPMLGANGPRDYLLLFLNNSELRAQGGISGSFALVHVDDGALSITRQASDAQLGSFDAPVYQLPEQTADLFTDVTTRFSQDPPSLPQFDRTAQIAKAMWLKRFGGHVDGVVSLDPVALGYLLKATGPVQLPGGFTLSAENAVSFLLSDIYAKVPNPAQQDEVFATAAASVFQRFADGGFDPQELISGLVQSGAERRINIWSDDASEQKLLAQTTLAGGLPTSTKSTQTFGVYVNDATGAKMDYYLRSSVGAAQRFCSSDGLTHYRVQIAMTNTAPANSAQSLPEYVTGGGAYGVAEGSIMSDVYVYAPPGVTVTGGQISNRGLYMNVAKDDGRSVGKYRILLDPGVTKIVTMDFTSKTAAAANTRTIMTPMIQPPDHENAVASCDNPPAPTP